MSGIIRPMTADRSTRLSSSMIFEFKTVTFPLALHVGPEKKVVCDWCVT